MKYFIEDVEGTRVDFGINPETHKPYFEALAFSGEFESVEDLVKQLRFVADELEKRQ